MTRSVTTTFHPDQLTQSDDTQPLSTIVKQLSEISRQLATAAEGDKREALEQSGLALEQVSQQLQQERERALLRRDILMALRQRGPALPIELAAETLSLPEEIAPLLEQMEREGVIAVREIRGGQLVTLTSKGRQELNL